MTDEPFRPDPADTVPPGERAELADTARHLVGERAELAETARNLVTSNNALAKTVAQLTERIKRSERRTFILAASLAMDVILTVVVTVVGVHFAGIDECFREATAAQDTQQIRQLDQQLSLFAKLRDPNASPQDREAAGVEYVATVTALKDALKAKGSDESNGNCS